MTPQEQPPFDLLIRRARLECQPGQFDIGIRAGRIAALSGEPLAGALEILETGGVLASPAFIDPHAHLDKCFLSPRPNSSGTLAEAIAIMEEHKGEALMENIGGRIDKALEMAVRRGTLTVRTHVDIGPQGGLRPLEALLEARARWAGLLDLQITAFPQEGILCRPGTAELLRDSIRLGADAVGGIPAIEGTPDEQHAHIDQAFDIASEFNVPVDMHIDESDDPAARTLEMLARATVQAGWQGRVSAAHCCSLAAQDDGYAAEVIRRTAEAGISVITNPSANLAIQGRGDRQPVRRGITRVKELLAAGVNVTCGHDNLQDSFYPFGQNDMLEVAFITALAAQLTGVEEVRTAAAMPRLNAARCLGLSDYGISVGAPADLVLVEAADARELLALRPASRTVVRRGRVVCRTEERTEWLLRLAGV